jgi:hypothetical protein
MLEHFYAHKKEKWKERSRKLFAIDMMDFLDGKVIRKLILRPVSPFYYASNDTQTSGILPAIRSITDCPTLRLPVITIKLPRMPSDLN